MLVENAKSRIFHASLAAVVVRAWVALLGVAAVLPALLPARADALCMAYRFPPVYRDAQRAAARGDLQEAERLYTAAARYPGQAKYWIANVYATAGHKAVAAGQLEESIRHFKRALAEQSSHFSAAQGLVHALSGAERYHEALDAYRGFDANLARNPLLLRLRARLHAGVRDRAGVREALEALRAQGRLQPADLELLSGTGGIRFRGPGKLGRI